MKSNSNFFSNSDKDDPRPNFPFDDDYRFDQDWFDDDICPNCEESLAEHTQSERLKCALDRIGGVRN